MTKPGGVSRRLGMRAPISSLLTRPTPLATRKLCRSLSSRKTTASSACKACAAMAGTWSSTTCGSRASTVQQPQGVGVGVEERAEDGALIDALGQRRQGRGLWGHGGPDGYASAGRDRRHEDVAGAAHRLDDLRVVGVVLELLAQAADL